MPIALTDDHRSLAAVAKSFASANSLRAATRAALTSGVEVRPAAWSKMAELGWLGLHLPEAFGGSGAGLPELAIVVEELGAAVAPGPTVAAVTGSAIIDRCGSAELRSALLPALAAGDRIAVFAVAPELSRDVDTVSGEASIAGGVWADQLILAVDDDLIVVATGAEGVTVTPIEKAADASLGLATVRLDAVRGAVLSHYASTALAIARTVASAEAAGGARATLEMALAYAKVREQFGRIIGSFQAVKHHLANMLVASERATAAAWDAARAVGHADDPGEYAAAVAAIVALDAYVANAQQNIQVHGGIGFTWEHDAHLYLRRAITLAGTLRGGAEAQLVGAVAAGVRRDVGVELPPEAEKFREQARTFRTAFEATPAEERRTLLVDSGYLLPHWPKPWGRAAGPVEQLVLDEEFDGLDIPRLGIGGWVLLTLVQQASPEQVERWVPPSLAGVLKWCQLFSEPGAGSDAAAVQTKAIRVEGGWRVTGQKVWTSGALSCNRGLATVRTNPDAPKHRGITTMALDLEAEGVTIRPLREITGEAMFNEVFFDDLFVPDEDVVGAVDDGWTVARATLGNERVSIGGGGGSLAATSARDLVTLLDGAAHDAGRSAEVGRLIAAEQAMRLITLRQVERSVVGGPPGPEGNVTKLLKAEHMQAVTELALRILGPGGVDGHHYPLLHEYLLGRCMTIAGGTSEVSRNVIAERILGLPREAVAN
jgi:alkylation response protein AidB-like acyl-CoA dehydrogenase